MNIKLPFRSYHHFVSVDANCIYAFTDHANFVQRISLSEFNSGFEAVKELQLLKQFVNANKPVAVKQSESLLIIMNQGRAFVLRDLRLQQVLCCSDFKTLLKLQDQFYIAYGQRLVNVLDGSVINLKINSEFAQFENVVWVPGFFGVIEF